MTINFNCGIYRIRNTVTEFCCAGQSINLKNRPSQHWSSLKNNKHHNQYLQNSYNKHGRKCFVFEILLYCEPEELTRYEQFFVSKYVALGLSYNICIECVDSCKGVKRTEETKERMSIAAKNKPSITDKTRKLMSESQKNKPSPTEETRNRLSESRMGKKNNNFGKHLSKETCKKLSEANSGENHPMFGKHHSEETCKKMSESSKGKNNSMFGKRGENSPRFGTHLSDKTKGKISEANKGKNNTSIIKKEIVLDILKLLGVGISVIEISKKTNVSSSTIYKIKNGGYDDIYDLPKDDKEI
ncbi:MAG TPA: NUMOD3 domain-containing DNA-binding protein [Candidatus Paceibacterota bacterium]|nr:NUMOD3 domain-containing DNA-binding protein [Candidatus Paceibacterota bacterium]